MYCNKNHNFTRFKTRLPSPNCSLPTSFFSSCVTVPFREVLMASSSTDTKANTQNAEHAEPTVEAKQNVVTEAPPVPSSAPSVFVNSEPIREDQVENAVKFLSHPKVRGSPVMYRRSFLEKKGLTKEEIDEAFRRVPDPTPTVQAATISQDAQPKQQPISQPQAALQAGQPLAAAPNGGMKTVSGYRFHWTHAAYAIGLLAASGAGSVVIFKKSILPRLKSWVRQVVEEEENPSKAKPSLTEEAAAAAKAASAAALEMSKASQELVNMKIEEKKKFEEITTLFDSQLQELKSMRSAVTKLEGQPNTYNPAPFHSQDTRGYGTNSRSYANGRTEYDYHSARTASPPPPVAPSSTLHPKSYMEDINDAPINPHHGMSDSRIAPKSKPWEGGQTRNPPNQYYHSDEGWNYNSQDSSSNSSMPLDWQRRNPSTTEVDYNNATSFRAAEKVTVQQRPWAPPGTPPISLAGAEEAIRRPKQSIQKDQVYSDGSQAAAADATSDELQRVTRMSESGGGNLPEMNGGNSVMNSIEIQEEQESY